MNEPHIPGKRTSRNYAPGVVRPVEIAIGKDLIPIADNFIIPEALNAAERCSTFWGFDIRPLRIYDDPGIDGYEYQVFIMGKYRGTGYLKRDMYFTMTEDELLPEGCEHLTTDGRVNKKYCWVPYLKKEVMQDRSFVLICSSCVFKYHIMHIIDRSISMLYSPFTLIKAIRQIEGQSSSFFFTIPDWMTYFTVLYQLNKKLLSEGFPINNVHEIFEIIINNPSLINDIDGLYKIAREELKKSFTLIF